jgi:DNA recombination-dependent growth factor C
MGALQGSLSYLRFFVDGDLPRDPASSFERSIHPRRFSPASPTADPPESTGWVATEAPFDDDSEIGRGLFWFGSRVVITYREDKYVVSKSAVRRAMHQKLTDIEKAENKNRTDMTRAFLKAVERSVTVELRTKSQPRTSLVDIVWDVERKEARVFGRGKMVTERLALLFERTFGMRLVMAVPAARAYRTDLSQRAQAVLERLEREPVFGPL